MAGRRTISQMILSPKIFQLAMNWLFIPWVGAGIRLSELSNDWNHARTELRPYFFNMNYVGVHFGGSLYSMCDPIYMLLLMNVLDKNQFIVWDKASTIEYVKPGIGTVAAEFTIKPDLVKRLEALEAGEKSVFELPVTIIDEGGDVVANLTKTLYVKRKRQFGGKKDVHAKEDK